MQPKWSRTLAALGAIGLLLITAALTGCAAPLPQSATTLSPEPGGQALQLTAGVEVGFDNGFKRTLKPGTRWALVGRTPEGEVFKPLDQVFTIEGAHVDEAYLVVSQGRLTGYYLPARQSFSRAAEQVNLPAKRIALP